MEKRLLCAVPFPIGVICGCRLIGFRMSPDPWKFDVFLSLFEKLSKGCRPSPQKRKRSLCRVSSGLPCHCARGFFIFEDNDFLERKLSMSNQFCATSTPVQDIYEVMLIMRAALIAGLKEVRDGSTDNLDGLILLAEDLTERLERAYEALEGSANQS